MGEELVARWREEIVGDWRSELAGVDLLYLGPSGGRFTLSLALRPDGTAGYDFTLPDPPARPAQPEPPFPPRWELSDERVLSVWLPVPPMPAYGLPEWSREQVCYDVLAVTDVSLCLSSRRFDVEDVLVLRRVNRDEFDRR